MTDPILEIRDAHVTFKRPGGQVLKAVNGVSLAMQPGEVVGLVGESGCGKSTLARAITGLQPLESGQILFRGKEIRPLGLRRRKGEELSIQMVFQNPYASLNPRRRISDQIEDGRAVSSTQAPTVKELLERVQLPAHYANRFPHEFSGGERQRIAIARAIAASPQVLVGDEPIASLDASLQIHVAELMRDLAKDTGASLLFITHDLAIVRQICNRIIVMNAGKIVEQGPAEEIWDSPQETYTRKLLAAIPIADGLGTIPVLD
ncbi:MAG: ATP-binding cassette domain-containing protein [Actinomycetaceae bacterium]|nr:ATP-binding cassette domain-containing protein [Actinomycetaceae bacterium]